MDQIVGVSENIDSLFHSLENFTQKEGIIGKPVVQGDKTFIPVLSVSVGYGSGNMGSKDNKANGTTTGSGSGALGLGARLSTDAVIVIDANNVSMLPMGSAGNVNQIMEKIPQMVMGLNQNKQGQQGQ